VNLEPNKLAIVHGCHVLCDKPLTDSGDTSPELHRLAVEKGVKTAYAASFSYMPHIIHAKEIIASGVIGEPFEE